MWQELRSDLDIKNCPCCGGSAKLTFVRSTNPNGSEWGEYIEYQVSCRTCGLNIKTPSKYFNDYTNFSYEDFRRDALLQIQEENGYKKYCHHKQREVIDLWNTRKGA